jgi:3-methyl-2-oxobutanoate hydroxymethyltransferase
MNNSILNIKLKKNKSKIICLTAYSKNIASVLDKHCDIILVGDSLGSVLYNYSSSKKVSLDMMIEHSKSVRMGVKKSLMVVDMPYNTYRNPKEALKNAKKIISITKCDAVKLEGGKKIYQIVKNLVKNKIQVMGHLGVLPQSAKSFKFVGKKLIDRKKILKDSKLLEQAGAFSFVLECVESSLAKEITRKVNIPTIGIGASVHCDGQVLVTDDLIGLNEIGVRFVKKYSNVTKQINDAVIKFKQDVIKGKFPSKKYSYQTKSIV